MLFAFSEEQRALAASVRTVLTRTCTRDHVRKSWSSAATAGHERTPAWATLAEIGFLGALVPTEEGGLGQTVEDVILAVEECGRAGLPDPVVATALVIAPLVVELGDATLSGILPELVAGNATLAFASPLTPLVEHAEGASFILAVEEGRLIALRPTEVSLVKQPSVDGARRLFAVTRIGEGRVVAEGAGAATAVANAADRGALAAAAELVGLGTTMLEMAIEHVKTRHQFGVPIGTFQAVKHQLATAKVALAFARPVVHEAAYRVSRGDAEAPLHVSHAKARAGDAALVVGRAALQCHGAIGYSFEHDLHLFMKRAWALASSWGDAAFHRERIARAILDT